MNRLVSFLLLLFTGASYNASAGTCTIKGSAPGRAGYMVKVYLYDDFITGTETKLTEAITGDSGKFSLSFETNDISYIFLKCENLYGFLFAQPGRSHIVTFPAKDPLRHLNSEVMYEVPLQIMTVDSADMNFLAGDYNTRFDKFWKDNYQYFVAGNSYAVLDSFHRDMDKHYRFVNLPYFHVWMNYGLAAIENATFHSEKKIALQYIVNKPVYYNNNEYMNFFNSFFQDYLYKWTVRKEGEKAMYAINVLGNYDSLMSGMKKLPWIQNDTLRELVLLKGLFEIYNNPAYNSRNVISIAQQASTRSKISEHRKIARNIIHFYTRLRVGSAAPHFMAADRKGMLLDPLEANKGKYVYLYFYATWNSTSMNEMRYMSDLQKKYGKKIVFVCVSVDKDTTAWKNFLKANPKYNWAHYHYDFRDKTKEEYNLYAVPAGFIIDPEGKFFTSPADNPSGDLEYVLYRIANPKAPPLMKPEDK